MFNQVTLIGNLGKDPEVRTLGSGDRVCNFSMATSESWKDKSSGDRKERTQWHNIVIFNDGLAKVCEQYLKKGSKVMVQGQVEYRKYEKDGQDRYVTEIVLRFNGTLKMLGEKGEGNGGGRSSSSGSSGGNSKPSQTRREDLDDDIPFMFIPMPGLITGAGGAVDG